MRRDTSIVLLETNLEHDKTVSLIAPSHYTFILRALQHLVELANLVQTLALYVPLHRETCAYKVAGVIGRLARWSVHVVYPCDCSGVS